MDEYRLRVQIFTGLIILVLGILGARLVQVQVIQRGDYATSAVRQNRVMPPRGAIYDRKGRLIVDNALNYTIRITPRSFDTTRIGFLADLLSVSDSLVRAKVDEARRRSPYQAYSAFKEVDFNRFSHILENIYLLPGISYEVQQSRRYKSEATASHAIGYIREITPTELEARRGEHYRQGDRIGKSGIERQYEPYLRGRLGSEFRLYNTYGLDVKSYEDGREDVPAQSGFDLHLSLDADVQALAESLFVNKRGGAVALDPKTGEIISIVSKPDYDPAIFTESVDSETWKYLTQSPEKPMYNRATMMSKPPGSTWKPFMDLMALQEGLITPDETINCPGYHPLGGSSIFRCMHVHGNISMRRAIESSCNTYHFELMYRGNVEMLNRYASMFGFGHRAPTDLGEQNGGLVPDSSYFDRIAGKNAWGPGWTLSLGIGQGNLLTTPLQLARYTAAVGNRGTLVPPHLVRTLVNPETGERIYPSRPASKEIPIDKEHFDVVREGMRMVMENGTGRWVQIPGIPSGGKTGTSQNPHGEDHSVFIMFAPYDDPQIAIGVIVENAGYGGSAAGPIASLMAEQYLTGKITTENDPGRRLQKALTSSSEPLEENN